MNSKTGHRLAATIIVTAWISGVPAATDSDIEELRWIPASARLLMVFDRPAENRALFARLRDEILFATDMAERFQDFVQLIGEDRSHDLERILIAAVPGEDGRYELIGIVRGLVGRQVLSRLSSAGKRVSRPRKGRPLYTAGDDLRRNMAIASLNENHAAFGSISAIERVLALPRAESALQNRALFKPPGGGARAVQAWGIALPEWLGFHFDTAQLSQCDVKGNSISRGLAGLQWVRFTVQLSSEADFRMRSHARDTEDAVLLADAQRSFLSALRHGNNSAPSEVRTVLEGGRIEREGATVELSLRLSLAAMERIRKNESSRRILRWQLEEQERELKTNIREILDLMQIGEVSRVADIGCGLGFFTVRLARLVGARGRVFAVDVDPVVIGELQKRVGEAPFPQVEVIRGELDDPKLAPDALDAALIFNSYHEMTEHQKMLERIYQALKPGGRFLLVEPFSVARRKDPRDSQMKEHLLAPELAEEELRRAGFEIVVRNDEFSEHPDTKTSEWLILSRRPKESAGSSQGRFPSLRKWY